MSLPAHQQNSLDAIPANKGAILISRHSIREDAANGMAGFQIPLTAEGVSLAESWGQQIGPRFSCAVSSPSPRCVDTGAAMLRGAGMAMEVGVLDLLREPHCYVEDISKAGPWFKQAGTIGFINGTLQGKVPGAWPVRDATNRLLRYLKSICPAPGQIALCVTHDTVLGTFIHDLIGRDSITDADLPAMMEGAFLWQVDAQWHWVWRGETYSQ